MLRSQKVASEWNGRLGDSPRACVAGLSAGGGKTLMMILGDSCASEEVFRYAGKVRRADLEQKTREVPAVMGKKMKSWSVPFPEVICTSDPRAKGCSVACILTSSFLPCHDEAALWGVEEQRLDELGSLEKWLSSVPLRDECGYLILSIGVCKWKCQSGRKTNESDRRDASSLAKCLINCHCLFWVLYFLFPLFFGLLFFDCFFSTGLGWFAAKILRVNFESVKESIGDRNRCFHLLLTSVGLWKAILD